MALPAVAVATRPEDHFDEGIHQPGEATMMDFVHRQLEQILEPFIHNIDQLHKGVDKLSGQLKDTDLKTNENRDRISRQGGLVQGLRGDLDNLGQSARGTQALVDKLTSDKLVLEDDHEKTKGHLGDLDRNFHGVAACTAELQLEARRAAPMDRAKLAKEEANLRAELRATAQELEQIKKDLLLNRDSGGSTERLFLAREERQRASAVTDTLRRSNNHLKKANTQALETEEVGVQALQELRKQREQIMINRDRTSELGQNLTEAKRAVGELEKTCVMM